MYLRQQLRAPHDSNGNPRRVWVLFAVEPGTAYTKTVDAVDEGYAGDPAGADDPSLAGFRDSVQLPSVDVSVSEYRRMLRWGSQAYKIGR